MSDSELPLKRSLAVAISMAVTGPAAQAQDDGAASLEEVTVTARKVSQSLQDVSASVQAFTGSELERQGLNNMEDVIRFIPSISHVGGTAGANKIIFRGVSDNPGAFIAASSAALYIDEQPLTQFSINPEPRMVDIERVEALAGPQGTLYGDSSQSGTLRIITNKPDPSKFEAKVDTTIRTGEESDESYDVNAVVNWPIIEDKLAIRIVGFTAEDGGFVDNVLGFSPMQGTRDNSALVGKDINSVEHSGGRLSAKWFVNDDWSVTAAVLAQKTEAEGRNDFDPTVGDLKTVKFFKDTRDDDWWQAAVTIEGKIGGLDFLSSTSYFERDIDYVFDRTSYSAYFNYNFCPYYATYCWSGPTRESQDTVGFNTLNQKNDRFTQEIRLSQQGDNYRWVLGAFYEEKNEEWEYRAVTPEFLDSLAYYYWTSLYEPSNTDPSWWLSADDTTWEQWAVFGNFVYDFNEKWSAEVGLRYFDQDMDRDYFVDKPFIISPNWPDVTNPQGNDSDFVPKVSLTHRFDDERMVYALYSEGFRSGGANRNRVPEELTVLPISYEPDKLKNYELGMKTRWLDNRLQVNATFFYMQWENYQIETIDPSFQPCSARPDLAPACGQPFQVMVANVGDAEQIGLEADIQAAVSQQLNVGMNFTILEAETSEDFEVTTIVPEGTRLPNVPDFKFNVFAQYNWPVNFVRGGEMYVRAQYSYQDDTRSQLEFFPEAPPLVASTPTRTQSSYGIGDLKIGLETETWEAQAFVNNFTDERAEIYNDVFFHDTFFGRDRLTTNRPREYGLRFTYRWD